MAEACNGFGSREPDSARASQFLLNHIYRARLPPGAPRSELTGAVPPVAADGWLAFC
jgi:hypothetical protein